MGIQGVIKLYLVGHSHRKGEFVGYKAEVLFYIKYVTIEAYRVVIMSSSNCRNNTEHVNFDCYIVFIEISI